MIRPAMIMLIGLSLPLATIAQEQTIITIGVLKPRLIYGEPLCFDITAENIPADANLDLALKIGDRIVPLQRVLQREDSRRKIDLAKLLKSKGANVKSLSFYGVLLLGSKFGPIFERPGVYKFSAVDVANGWTSNTQEVTVEATPEAEKEATALWLSESGIRTFLSLAPTAGEASPYEKLLNDNQGSVFAPYAAVAVGQIKYHSLKHSPLDPQDVEKAKAQIRQRSIDIASLGELFAKGKSLRKSLFHLQGSFFHALSLAHGGNLLEARSVLQAILKDYPDYQGEYIQNANKLLEELSREDAEGRLPLKPEQK